MSRNSRGTFTATDDGASSRSEGCPAFEPSRQRTSAGGTSSRNRARAAACQLSNVGSISTVFIFSRSAPGRSTLCRGGWPTTSCYLRREVYSIPQDPTASALAVASEKTVFGSRVRVEVVGDVAHVTVHPELAEPCRGDLAQFLAHVRHVSFGRRGAVEAPHDHWRLADLALGDPADVVLEEPRRHLQSLAKVAVLDLGELGTGRGRRAHGPYPTVAGVGAIILAEPERARRGGPAPPG